MSHRAECGDEKIDVLRAPARLRKREHRQKEQRAWQRTESGRANYSGSKGSGATVRQKLPERFAAAKKR
jgi:hypothetical protein